MLKMEDVYTEDFKNSIHFKFEVSKILFNYFLKKLKPLFSKDALN